jgi:ribosomal protein RSM22 (predicted rRNA methylase)
MASALPAELKAALDSAAFGVSRTDAAKRAAAISERYRSGGGSQSIRDESDALAYALTRMPATYAAVAACLDAVAEILPDFAPKSALDLGAGPGTASWAVSERYASVAHYALIDANPALRNLALRLRADHAFAYRLGDAAVEVQAAEPADLVIASYVAAELTTPAIADLFARAWDKTEGVLLVVEPGTPEGYRRILAIRDALVATGATVVAPCPHEGTCPLQAPDWCHFSQRLPRSRDHIQTKRADAPFEDEKFSYVALTRLPVPLRPARILSPPEHGKPGFNFKLCAGDGLEYRAVPRRDKAAYAAARRLRWGDVFPD